MYWLIAALFVAADQITKYLIRSNFSVGQSVPVIGHLVEFTYVQNTGAAFSILEGRQGFLSVFTIILMLAICVYYFINRKKIYVWEMVSWAMIFGGGVGNLICRIRAGFVTDFINIQIIPVFNVADIGITVGCVLLFLSVMIWEPKRNKTVDENPDSD